MERLPLLNVFIRLRNAGLSISIDEYESTLKALQEGFGVANYQDMKSICQALWVKSEDDWYQFNYHFDKILANEFEQVWSQRNARLAKRRKLAKIARNISILILFIIGVATAVWYTSLPRVSIYIIPDQGTDQNVVNSGISLELWLLLIFFTLLSLALVVWLVAQRVITNQSAGESFSTQSSSFNSKAQAESNKESEAKVSKAAELANSRVDEVFGGQPISATDYFPVTRRQMKQSWRYLRRFVREGPAVELDLDATVKQIGRLGLLLDPVLRPRRVNQAKLLILIDRDGSMVPFHALSQRLVDTAMGGGKISQAEIYYFHNYPVAHLYTTSTYQDSVPIQDMLTQRHIHRAGVLIFSDAGAARGGFSPKRIEHTIDFLLQVEQRVRHVAWLNPVPRSGWRGTTAEKISKFVPMFEFNRRGLDNSLGILRGQIR